MGVINFVLIARDRMSLSTLILILIIFALVVVFPSWPHSREWGYYPSGVLGILLIIFLALILTGHFNL